MRFRLDTQHYLMDNLLEAGTEIGDDTAYAFRDGDGNFMIPPSANMTPLDEEAADLYEEARSQRAKSGATWGRPEEGIPISGTSHNSPPVLGQKINRQAQPIIPAPIEHVTHPNDIKPWEPAGGRPNPLVEEAIRKTNERIAEDNDKRMAEQANARDKMDEARRRHEAERQNQAESGPQKGGGQPEKPSSPPKPVAPHTTLGQRPPSTQVPRDSDKMTDIKK